MFPYIFTCVTCEHCEYLILSRVFAKNAGLSSSTATTLIQIFTSHVTIVYWIAIVVTTHHITNSNALFFMRSHCFLSVVFTSIRLNISFFLLHMAMCVTVFGLFVCLLYQRTRDLFIPCAYFRWVFVGSCHCVVLCVFFAPFSFC